MSTPNTTMQHTWRLEVQPKPTDDWRPGGLSSTAGPLSEESIQPHINTWRRDRPDARFRQIHELVVTQTTRTVLA